MKKNILFFLLVLITFGCDDHVKGRLPQGFERVGGEDRIHFVYVEDEFIGDRVAQRDAGTIVCTEMFLHSDYCEVWFWKDKNDIPKGLPIINRKTLIGMFEMKNGKITIKPLTENDSQNVKKEIR